MSIQIDLPNSADGGVMFVTRMKFSSLVCKGKMVTVCPDVSAGYFFAGVAPVSNRTVCILLSFVFNDNGMSIPLDLLNSADGGVMFVTRIKFSSLVCKGRIVSVFPEISAGYFLAGVAPVSNWTVCKLLIFVLNESFKSMLIDLLFPSDAGGCEKVSLNR